MEYDKNYEKKQNALSNRYSLGKLLAAFNYFEQVYSNDSNLYYIKTYLFFKNKVYYKIPCDEKKWEFIDKRIQG